jgi:hypothetical protein
VPGREGNVTGRLQCPEKLLTFDFIMNAHSSIVFRRLRRFRTAFPGWVAA